MGLKPIDLQINILQTNNAATEINKQKTGDLNTQNYASSLLQKDNIDKQDKVEVTTKVQSTLPPLENELKEKQNQEENKRHKEESSKKEDKGNAEEKDKSLFADNSKGNLIDIKE